MNIRGKYQALKQDGKLHGTITRAVALRKQRDANPPLQPRVEGRIAAKAMANANRRAKPTAVPLGEATFLEAVQEENKRLREWSLGERAGVVIGSRWREETRGSNSDWKKRSTFQRGAIIQSYATCTHDVATLHLFGKVHSVKLPKGYRWDIDANGLVLLDRQGNDYHPTASDLVAAEPDPRKLARLLKEGIAARKAARAKAKQQSEILKKAEKEGASVCLRDSIVSGNCRAGSEQWARNHGLNPHSHYSPSQLLAMANGNASRVAIVVAAAIRRHRREMDSGRCELAEHCV